MYTIKVGLTVNVSVVTPGSNALHKVPPIVPDVVEKSVGVVSDEGKAMHSVAPLSAVFPINAIPDSTLNMSNFALPPK